MLCVCETTHLYICWWFYPGWPWLTQSCHTFKDKIENVHVDSVKRMNSDPLYAYQSAHISSGCVSTGVSMKIYSFCQSNITAQFVCLCLSVFVWWRWLRYSLEFFAADSSPGPKPFCSRLVFSPHDTVHTNIQRRTAIILAIQCLSCKQKYWYLGVLSEWLLPQCVVFQSRTK